ncbi:hypothetical protein PoB_000678100 [Plakobranchus ocellatus]|uniref:Uncharacterized protein n=1 Tax=Plakobranchus ocellatus TaxID=259542 RepID=A0AAV3YD06_9GAST|nr:hypothetical protein PoB_000678100 [Plakobranchus ocellatus]
MSRHDFSRLTVYARSWIYRDLIELCDQTHEAAAPLDLYHKSNIAQVHHFKNGATCLIDGCCRVPVYFEFCSQTSSFNEDLRPSSDSMIKTQLYCYNIVRQENAPPKAVLRVEKWESLNEFPFCSVDDTLDVNALQWIQRNLLVCCLPEMENNLLEDDAESECDSSSNLSSLLMKMSPVDENLSIQDTGMNPKEELRRQPSTDLSSLIISESQNNLLKDISGWKSPVNESVSSRHQKPHDVNVAITNASCPEGKIQVANRTLDCSDSLFSDTDPELNITNSGQENGLQCCRSNEDALAKVGKDSTFLGSSNKREQDMEATVFQALSLSSDDDFYILKPVVRNKMQSHSNSNSTLVDSALYGKSKSKSHTNDLIAKETGEAVTSSSSSDLLPFSQQGQGENPVSVSLTFTSDGSQRTDPEIPEDVHASGMSVSGSHSNVAVSCISSFPTYGPGCTVTASGVNLHAEHSHKRPVAASQIEIKTGNTASLEFSQESSLQLTKSGLGSLDSHDMQAQPTLNENQSYDNFKAGEKGPLLSKTSQFTTISQKLCDKENRTSVKRSRSLYDRICDSNAIAKKKSLNKIGDPHEMPVPQLGCSSSNNSVRTTTGLFFTLNETSMRNGDTDKSCKEISLPVWSSREQDDIPSPHISVSLTALPDQIFSALRDKASISVKYLKYFNTFTGTKSGLYLSKDTSMNSKASCISTKVCNSKRQISSAHTDWQNGGSWCKTRHKTLLSRGKQCDDGKNWCHLNSQIECQSQHANEDRIHTSCRRSIYSTVIREVVRDCKGVLRIQAGSNTQLMCPNPIDPTYFHHVKDLNFKHQKKKSSPGKGTNLSSQETSKFKRIAQATCNNVPSLSTSHIINSSVSVTYNVSSHSPQNVIKPAGHSCDVQMVTQPEDSSDGHPELDSFQFSPEALGLSVNPCHDSHFKILDVNHQKNSRNRHKHKSLSLNKFTHLKHRGERDLHLQRSSANVPIAESEGFEYHPETCQENVNLYEHCVESQGFQPQLSHADEQQDLE